MNRGEVVLRIGAILLMIALVVSTVAFQQERKERKAWEKSNSIAVHLLWKAQLRADADSIVGKFMYCDSSRYWFEGDALMSNGMLSMLDIGNVRFGEYPPYDNLFTFTHQQVTIHENRIMVPKDEARK